MQAFRSDVGSICSIVRASGGRRAGRDSAGRTDRFRPLNHWRRYRTPRVERVDCAHRVQGRQAHQANSTDAWGDGASEASGARRQTCAAATIRTILLIGKTEVADASEAFGPFAVGGGCSLAPSLTPDNRTSLTMSALSKVVLSALLRSLRRVSRFVVLFGPVSMTTARL